MDDGCQMVLYHLHGAETLWIKEAQQDLHKTLTKGEFLGLGPFLDDEDD